MQNISRASFLKYAKHRDELLQLEIRVLQYTADNRHTKPFCANNAWYGAIKPRVLELAGWEAKDKRLRTQAAYDAVYDYLYSLLPDCKHDTLCWVRPESVEL
jgi:hypothetical protein